MAGLFWARIISHLETPNKLPIGSGTSSRLKSLASRLSDHVIKNAYEHSMIGIAVEDAPPSTLRVLVRLKQ